MKQKYCYSGHLRSQTKATYAGEIDVEEEEMRASREGEISGPKGRRAATNGCECHWMKGGGQQQREGNSGGGREENNDGGQKVVLPTGRSVQVLQDLNLNPNLNLLFFNLNLNLIR